MLEAAAEKAATERSSRSEPLSDREATQLLKRAQEVIVCRGRKATRLPANDVAVADLKGPTGKVRAPLLQIGDTLVVGFSAAVLDELVS